MNLTLLERQSGVAVLLIDLNGMQKKIECSKLIVIILLKIKYSFNRNYL